MTNKIEIRTIELTAFTDQELGKLPREPIRIYPVRRAGIGPLVAAGASALAPLFLLISAEPIRIGYLLILGGLWAWAIHAACNRVELVVLLPAPAEAERIREALDQ